jgi:hypothetical protein
MKHIRKFILPGQKNIERENIVLRAYWRLGRFGNCSMKRTGNFSWEYFDFQLLWQGKCW